MAEFVKLDNNTFFDAVKESISDGNHVKIPVTGNSMRPFLRDGDVVSIAPRVENDIEKGAIVLAYWNNGYVLHRVVKTDGNILILAGDNNLGQIENVINKDIIAVVRTCYRDEKLFSTQSRLDRFLGLGWYYLRWPRRVLAKIMRELK